MRYLPNYPNDIIAGNISRSPVYVMFDNAVIGVEDNKVLNSALNAFVASCAGWSLTYVMGNSLLSSFMGDFYKKHARKIKAVYSSAMTFGFGVAVHKTAGYTWSQALLAAGARSAIALPLGPVTTYYTNSFREARGEKPIDGVTTKFKGKSLSYSLPRIAKMILVPAALAAATIMITPDKPIEDVKIKQPSQEMYIQPDDRKKLMPDIKDLENDLSKPSYV